MMRRRIVRAPTAVAQRIHRFPTKSVVVMRSYTPSTKVQLRLSKGDFDNEGADSFKPSDMFRSVLERADRTLEYAAKFRSEGEEGSGTVDNKVPIEVTRELLDTITDNISRKEKSPVQVQSVETMELVKLPTDGNDAADDHDDDDDLLNYGKNPTITMTALAHTLWKSILRPGKDSAIDATCGNGGDATALAELLFARPSRASSPSSHLVCIDIQQEACQATRTQLSKVLSDELLQHQVTIEHGSHAPLTLPPPHAGPVAVVAFNLGYLPQQERSADTTTTQTGTTLTALTDAVLCLRVGGVLSVITYPKTNLVEDAAVQAFVEGLALFSSQSYDWREFLVDDTDPVRSYYPIMDDKANREEIRLRLQHIHQELGARQCWRVHVHEKLGWRHAPRLLTATRVR